MTTLREAAQQALDSINELFAAEQSEGGERGRHIRTPATREHLVRVAQARRALHESCDTLRAALAQAEPAAGKVVAWGVFANIDGEWQLQHPVFAGDEQGKVNSEFERASYSGPQPLEVRPLGVVTATAQQAEPPNLADPAVQKRLAAQWGYVPAEQVEPVAWIESPHGAIRANPNYKFTFPSQLLQWQIALYIAPPQRLPLTEEEIYRATGHCGVSKYTAINIARAVERAHGIGEQS